MNELNSKNITLRLATFNDAEFIYSLRTDEKLNQHVSKVLGTVENQLDWLKNYKLREVQGSEYYFVISRRDTNQLIGTVRLYGIINNTIFSWGSWILNDNKTSTSALESACLIYKFAFEIKEFTLATFQVDKKNVLVSSFHLKSGAKIVSEDDVNFNFEFDLNAYKKFKNKFFKYFGENV